MRPFKVGDRVTPVGIDPSSPEYDVGTVVKIVADLVGVHWERADEIYIEDPAALELYQPTGGN